MKTYHLTIQAQQRPETLERLLRVIRHRGFAVVQLTVESHNSLITLTATVESERELALLVHQLIKLPDVVEVK